MIILTIGEASRRLADAAAVEENWVTYHMRPATVDSAAPGVHVRIDAPSMTLNLSAGEPLGGEVFDRRVSPAESRVLDLWQERGLDRPDFRSGQVVAFLHQLYDVLEQESAARVRTEVVAGTASAGLYGSGVPT